MDREQVINEYAKLGINSQNELYNFMINNNNGKIFEKNYNLKNSNETMEFMANFLTALNFEVTRLFFEKKNLTTSRDNCHWFLAFHSEFKWYYYETTMEKLNGQYTFENYKNLTTFAVTNLINEFEKGTEINTDKLNEKYTLREISPLIGLKLKENILQSEEGVEILSWSDLVGNFTYEQFIKPPQDNEKIAHRKRKNSNFGLFLIGFSFTLVICLVILWTLTIIFSGNK